MKHCREVSFTAIASQVIFAPYPKAVGFVMAPSIVSRNGERQSLEHLVEPALHHSRAGI